MIKILNKGKVTLNIIICSKIIQSYFKNYCPNDSSKSKFKYLVTILRSQYGGNYLTAQRMMKIGSECCNVSKVIRNFL
jgi:hypothetical protein